MMNTLKPWLVLAGIFLAGALSGAALTMVLGPHFHHTLGGEAQISKRIMGRLTDELGLTPDQQQKIQPVIDESAKELREVHGEEVRRVGQIIRLTNEQIAPFLTPDQKAHLDKIETDGNNSIFGRRPGGFNDHMHPNPPGPPGGPPQPQPPLGAPPPPATNAPPR
jgi:hypothetical protein